MKKTLFKKITTVFLTLCITALLTVSCSSSDSPAQDPDVYFTNFSTSTTDVFIDQKITLDFAGTGNTDVSVTSSSPSVIVTQKSATIYELSSTTAVSTSINVLLSNKTKKASKYVNITFNEHGVKTFNTVEGILVRFDKSPKVINLLGQPDLKVNSTTTGNNNEIWYYAIQGLIILVDKTSTVVQQIDMVSSDYSFTNANSVKVNFTTYPYEIGNGWKINSSKTPITSSTTTMDIVVNQFGTLYKSSSSGNLFLFDYGNRLLGFYFVSDSVANFTGKLINGFSIY